MRSKEGPEKDRERERRKKEGTVTKKGREGNRKERKKREQEGREAEANADLLGDFVKRPILSIGPNGTAILRHNHDETWMVLLTGRKAWFLAKPGVAAQGLVPAAGTPAGDFPGWNDPCAHLETVRPAGVHLCVQEAGVWMSQPSCGGVFLSAVDDTRKAGCDDEKKKQAYCRIPADFSQNFCRIPANSHITFNQVVL